MSRPNKPTRKPDVRALLGRLAAEEEKFLQQEFLAPVLRGGRIQVRIAGVVCQIQVRPNDFQGWGIFQPLSHTEAQLVRPAAMGERRRYLELFPMALLVVCRQAAGRCFGSAAKSGDNRFQIEGLVPIHLAENVQTFDVVRCRYDGALFWFDEADGRHDPARAAYLRTALAQPLPPEELDRPGLTAEERAAYEVNFWELMAAEESEEEEVPQRNPPHRLRRRPPAEPRPEDAIRQRLRETLSHAGAQLIDYLERDDSFRVTYSVGGRRYTSAVSKADLSVQVAGICLSGEDRKFDLASLVGVLHEARGGVIRVGDEGLDEEDYWDVHPPRNP